jgi:hypothetical protein
LRKVSRSSGYRVSFRRFLSSHGEIGNSGLGAIVLEEVLSHVGLSLWIVHGLVLPSCVRECYLPYAKANRRV